MQCSVVQLILVFHLLSVVDVKIGLAAVKNTVIIIFKIRGFLVIEGKVKCNFHVSGEIVCSPYLLMKRREQVTSDCLMHH